MILATSLFHLKLASSLSAIEYNVLIEYVFYLVYMMAVLGIIATLIINYIEEKLSTDKESLERMKETDVDGIGSEDGSVEFSDERQTKQFKLIEGKIGKDKKLINRIILVGRIGYPIIILMTLFVLSYGKL
jgi:hypothetical protein